MVPEDEIEEGETYYDLFLRYWGDLAYIIKENVPENSSLYTLCESATPSRVIAAVDFFTRVIKKGDEAGVSKEFSVKKVLINFGAPHEFCEGEKLAEVVSAIEDLGKILEACRKE